MKKYQARIKPDHSYRGHNPGEELWVDEYELQSFDDLLEDLQHVEIINATEEAEALAREYGKERNLVRVQGSGKDGRILIGDVEAILG